MIDFTPEWIDFIHTNRIDFIHTNMIDFIPERINFTRERTGFYQTM